jgi:peptidoglycan/xylan/chitin deacetylase (PgdA/CDA1 family)
MLVTSDFSELGLPMRLVRPVQVNPVNGAKTDVVRPEITSRELNEEFTDLIGAAADTFALSTRVPEFQTRADDEVLVQAGRNGAPLVVRRDEEVIVNFDVRATQAVHFEDSGRPLYTYIPGFDIRAVPEAIRRPVSNLVQALRAPKRIDVLRTWRRLPLTGFEFTVLLLNTILARGLSDRRVFQWPFGKRAVFVALHDVDTGGFLRRRERDALFRIEAKHGIRSTWFIPTTILNRDTRAIDFLMEAGHEVGWHGHKHDHRDHIKPFARTAVRALMSSRLADPVNSPTGMRLPKLLKSNLLFELLESCQSLRYDTSFLQGIAPYYLWVSGKPSRILEIPTTVPTDILVYNQLHGLSSSRKADAVLQAQIARTEKVLEVGGVASIVTHPEKTLSERPDFLNIYDQYLSYIRGRSDIWFATAGQLFRHWTGESVRP